MMYTTARLVKIENNQVIAKDQCAPFFYELQHGVLLSLKEEGKLTMMQYRYAENILKKQRMTMLQRTPENGDFV